MSVVIEDSAAQPVNDTPAKPAIAKATAKNAERMANLDELHYEENVSIVMDSNEVLDLDAVMEIAMTANLDFFTDFPMVGKLHECRGLVAKDDLGRQSGRYSEYDVCDLDEGKKFLCAVFATRGIKLTTKAFGELSGAKNVNFCHGDKPCKVRVTSAWSYNNTKDKVGHFDKVIGVEVIDKNYPAGHSVKRFARVVKGMDKKLRTL